MKKHFYTEDIIKICDNKHLTVEQIFDELTEKYISVGKSSIYRNVEELVKKWILKKIIWVWTKTFYEKSKEDHIHLVNLETWKIIDLYNITIPKIELPKWFEIDNYDIKIFGKFQK